MNINCVISPIKPRQLKQFSFCEIIRNHVRSCGWPYGAGMLSSVSEQGEQGPRESASENPSHDSCNDGPTKSKEQWSVDELKASSDCICFIPHVW